MKNPVLFLIFLLLTHNTAFAEPINVVTLNWSPYVGEDLKGNGFHAQIVKNAFKQINKETNLKFLPWKRAYKKALNAEAFLMSASDTQERRGIFKK